MTTASPERWRVSCDGAARPHRGAIAVGVTLRSADGARHDLSFVPGACGCGNEAEAWALLMALDAARSRGARALDIQSDSAVVVAEIAGDKRTRVARLAALFDRIRAALRDFDDVTLRWVPRHKNAEADALARAALAGTQDRKAG